MIAMQYSFILPANYDMALIDQRIAQNGHKFDGFPGLRFKAFQSSRKLAGQVRDNRYAPFYLWNSPEAMTHFLSSDGFAAVCEAFGRPSIDIWPVWRANLSGQLAEARYASRDVLPISDGTHLNILRERAGEDADRQLGRDGALAVVTAVDPANWRQLRYTLWRDRVERAEADSLQLYDIGHMALP
ncbi:DUF4865 family protein [Chitinimonas naiadis]